MQHIQPTEQDLLFLRAHSPVAQAYMVENMMRQCDRNRLINKYPQLIEAIRLADQTGHGRTATNDDCEVCLSIRELRLNVEKCDRLPLGILLQPATFDESLKVWNPCQYLTKESAFNGKSHSR